MTRDPRAYVHNIVRSIELITQWIAVGRDEFMRNEQVQAAVLRKLHELSESVQRLHPLCGDRYAGFPWSEVIGFRQVVVHNYLGLNLERIWVIVTEHVPALKPHVDAMARDLDMPPSSQRPHS